MPSKPLHQRFTAIAIVLLLITGLLSLVLPSSIASAGNPPTYVITVIQPKDPVCVGESRVVTVNWKTNDTGGALAPLTGPRVMYATVRKGELDRYTYHPGPTSGTTTFTYTGVHVGTEQIFVQAMDINLEGDGQGEVQFDVKKCDYRFTLYAQLDADTQQGDTQMSILYVLRAKGLLKADPNRPGYFEAYMVRIHLETLITAFSVPDCTLFTWTPGSGEGLVDVSAEQIGETNTMIVRFSPPDQFTWKLDMAGECNDGDPVTFSTQIPLSSAKDPWIEATFPPGEGSQNVQIDLFEQGVNNFNKYPSNNASYTATVTLTRVESK
jgi:hypothetical protein